MSDHETEATIWTTRAPRFVIATLNGLMAVFGAAHAVTTLFEGTAGTADHASSDEAKIHEVIQEYAEAYTDGDAETVAALFTDDAVFVAPDGTRLDGPDEIEGMFRIHFDSGSLPLSMTLLETVVLGDTAYVFNTYAGLGDDGTPLVEGYALSLFLRVDGDWLWHRNVANAIVAEPEVQALRCVPRTQACP